MKRPPTVNRKSDHLFFMARTAPNSDLGGSGLSLTAFIRRSRRRGKAVVTGGGCGARGKHFEFPAERAQEAIVCTTLTLSQLANCASRLALDGQTLYEE